MAEPKVKLTLGATLPTDTQYENVQPTVEVEADTFEEAADIALAQIKSIADKVRSKNPFIIVEAKPQDLAEIETLVDIDGVKVKWNPAQHRYQDNYLSGSAFSHKFIQDFPADKISSVMAAKAGVPQEEILSMWKTNAEASTSLGTAIHAALELYGKYKDTSMMVKGDLTSAIHKNPFLKHVIDLFYKDRGDEVAVYEPFVALEDKKLCGFIDRLLIVDAENKIARIQDYKTNPDIGKKKGILAPFKTVIENTELGAYWLQLSFYAYIMIQKGWTIEGLDIFNICAREQEDGSLKIELETYSHDVIDISEALKA